MKSKKQTGITLNFTNVFILINTILEVIILLNLPNYIVIGD